MSNNKKVLLTIDSLKQYFPIKKSSFSRGEQLYVRANDDITLNIYEGETFGLVGESGCGKSTLGRTLLQLYNQTAGRTIYHGTNIYEVEPKYVARQLNKLQADKLKLEPLKAKFLEDEAKFNEASEANREEIAKDYKKSKEEYESLLKDMTNLAGGLVLLDDLTEASNLLEKEYKAKVNLLKDPNNESAKSEVKALEVEIAKLGDKVKDHPDYEDYQSHRTDGVDLTKLQYEEMRHLRKDLQLIFQDPYSSLNPRMTVGQTISEGLFTHNMYDRKDEAVQDYILETMEKCGLAKYFVHRYPHQFSGGQRQRIGIARSVALQPKFIVCDEAVSALDVSIQSQVINLLLDLKEQHNLTYLFISHDLSVIKYISDRVGVMYLGNIVELAPTAELYANPMHPYTTALLSAIPTTDVDSDKKMEILEGDIPSPIRPPKGCKFHTRCKYATDLCAEVPPLFEEVGPDHFVACHHKYEIKKNGKVN